MRRLAAVLALGALALPAPAAAFVPTDPLAAKQWYLIQDHAFDFWPELPTNLAPVKVAVIDSGIDVGHPEFAGKIFAARSFVGPPNDVTDKEGHGTFIAGDELLRGNRAPPRVDLVSGLRRRVDPELSSLGVRRTVMPRSSPSIWAALKATRSESGKARGRVSEVVP